MLVHLWDINCEVYLIFDFILAISSEPHQISATALTLQHIADSLFVEFALGQHADDQRSLLNQTNSSVLQFASCICLRVNVADFFQFQTAFQADSIVNATTYEEHIVCIGILCCKPLNVFDKDWSELPFAHREHIGCTVDYVSGRNRYMGYLISLGIYSFKGVKVGLDCANGSSWNIAKSVFDALGADTYVINAQPNGLNINNNAGSTHIEGLQKFVVEKGLDIGFAYDGDADRCLCVDEKGNVITGDHILYIYVPAILKYTRNVYYIGNLEFAKLTPGEAHFYDLNGDEIEKQTTEIKWDAEAAEKGGFEHFMMKEIHEQPKAVQDTLNSVIKNGAIDLSSVEITEDEIKNFEQIYIVACGSAWHVGMAAQYVLEDIADIPVRVELASEFRYRKMPLNQKALVIVVSQSGETADTFSSISFLKIVLHSFAQNNDLVRIFRSIFFALVDKLRAKS